MLLVNAPRFWHCRDAVYVKALHAGGRSCSRIIVCMWGEGHKVRDNINVCLLQQSMCRSECLAPERHVRSPAQKPTPTFRINGINCRSACCGGACAPPILTKEGAMQEAGSSRAAAPIVETRRDADVGRAFTNSASGRPPNQQTNTTRPSNLIVIKDGDPIPEGYKYVVEGRQETVPSPIKELRITGDTVDLNTPPRATEAVGGEAADAARRKSNARRNLTRNTNRNANTTFAKELKDSLASGRPANVKVPVKHTDLKSTWHAAAKESAYKLLDITKESWKDYSIFEKSVVHREVNVAYKFDPPIDPKRIDKYLSCHLRTSRAVWKAHWKKYGPEQRHHNCPEGAWAKLCSWWLTTACQEEAAEMANRRARVEKVSNVGRIALVDRMEVEVGNHIYVLYALKYGCILCYVIADSLHGFHLFRMLQSLPPSLCCWSPNI